MAKSEPSLWIERRYQPGGLSGDFWETRVVESAARPEGAEPAPRGAEPHDWKAEDAV